MDNGAIGFFLFFVILIIIWIFAMGGCVRERNSLEGYKEMGVKEFKGEFATNGKLPGVTKLYVK